MKVETITIRKTHNEVGAALALCDGPFAIQFESCRPIDDDEWEALFTLTHIPTGYAIRSHFPWRDILETLRELQARTDLNWTFTDPDQAKALGPAMKDINAAVAARLSGVETAHV